jgi:hypothetical protein
MDRCERRNTFAICVGVAFGHMLTSVLVSSSVQSVLWLLVVMTVPVVGGHSILFFPNILHLFSVAGPTFGGGERAHRFHDLVDGRVLRYDHQASRDKNSASSSHVGLR